MYSEEIEDVLTNSYHIREGNRRSEYGSNSLCSSRATTFGKEDYAHACILLFQI